MAKTRGRPRRGQLVDMTIQPTQPDCFEPPPPEDCEEIPYFIHADAGHLVGVRQVFRRGTSVVVYFAVWQSILVGGQWREVCRIDSAHGNVHRHDFTVGRDGKNVDSRVILEEITAQHAEEILDRWIKTAEEFF